MPRRKRSSNQMHGSGAWRTGGLAHLLPHGASVRTQLLDPPDIDLSSARSGAATVSASGGLVWLPREPERFAQKCQRWALATRISRNTWTRETVLSSSGSTEYACS